MGRNRSRGMLVEAGAFVAVAIIAFVAGLLIGDLGGSPKTETVVASNSAGEGGGAEAPQPGGEATEAGEGAGGAAPEAEGTANGPGAQIFVSAGCGSCHAFKAAGTTGTTGPDLNEYLEPDDDKPGIEEMIVDPNAEIAQGYSANVMPTNFGETLSSEEVQQLVAFLYENSPASETPTGEQGEKEPEKRK